MAKVQVIATDFTSENETIRGDFVLPEGDGPFPGICKFHGLPGSSDQVSGIATRLAEAGFIVLTFDFRGFRRSGGLFTLAGEIVDAGNAITHLQEYEQTAKNWIGVYGASYGGAVAICSAARDKRISAVCLRAPVYDPYGFALSPMIAPEVKRILEETPDIMHGLSHPDLRAEIFQKMVEDGKVFKPMDEIAKIAPRPIFIITGDADMGIDVGGVCALFDSAGHPKEMVIVKGADHSLTDAKAFETTVCAVVEWFCRQKP